MKEDKVTIGRPEPTNCIFFQIVLHVWSGVSKSQINQFSMEEKLSAPTDRQIIFHAYVCV